MNDSVPQESSRFKRCNSCKTVFIANSHNFPKDKTAEDGLSVICRTCKRRMRKASPDRTSEGLKQCIECEKWLPFDSFSSDCSKKDGLRTWCKKCYAAGPGKEKNLRRGYGITLEQHDHMLTEQGSVCKVCGQLASSDQLVIDHDHNTGIVRALLCRKCNVALGMMDEDPERIQQLKEYAEWCKTGEASMAIDQLQKLLEIDAPEKSIRKIEKSEEGKDKSISYQHQYRKCGKALCIHCTNGEGHGPYWYAYWREDGKVKSKYIGKAKPE
jgi:hypothetical protein